MKKWLIPLTFLSFSLSAESTDCFSSCECCPIEHSGYLHLKHREPGGIGYPRGYTSLSLFYTGSQCGPRYSFIDLRAHLDNDGKWASNVGVGSRFMAKYSDVITGFNLYWDWRDGKRGSYHKIGLGGEVLWPYWDIHVNGYIPIGNERRSTNKGFDHFSGHSAYMFKKYLLNMGGLDASVGYFLFKCGCVDMHASLGGYYFRGNFHADFGGGIAKAKLRFWDWIELEGQVSYDNKFKWIGQGELGIYIPFGPTLKRYPRTIGCCDDLIALEQRLLEQPDRFEISVLASHKRVDKARHPITGKPLTFYFVNNTSSSSGTFESPFPTITQAITSSNSSDAIYIFPGNGAGYEEMITLKDQQLFGGSGAPFEVATRFGILAIPQLTASKPAMTGAGNKLTLSNNNRISGMSLTSSDSDAISGINIRNFDLTNNTLDAQVLLSNVTGKINIWKNFLSSQMENGISIEGTLGEINFLENFVSSPSASAVFISNFKGKADFSNNVLFGVDGGLFLLNSFIGKINCANNAISAPVGIGMGDFSGQANFLSNTISTTDTGISCTGTFTGSANFSQNFLSTATSGIEFLNFSGTCNLKDNTITAGTSGIQFQDYSGNFSLINNSITAMQSNGLSFRNFTGNFFATHNYITANETGLELSSQLFSGNLIAEYNYVKSKMAGIGSDISGVGILQSEVLLRNNTFVNSENSSNNAAIDIISGGRANALIHNNRCIRQDSNIPSIRWITTSNIAHIQFADNLCSSPNAASDISFSVVGGTLELESPNLDLSGVQAINEGVISTTGVTFVPFE